MNYGDFTALFADARNALAYVSDLDTYEMVFMTKAAMEMVGLKDPAEYRGKKCYQLMQGLDAPCPFCTHEKLLAGQGPCVWTQYNPVVKKWVRLEDHLLPVQGHNWHGQWATDIDREHDTIADLQDQLELEKVLMKSIHTLALETDAHRAVELFLEYIGSYYQADRTVIFEIDHIREVVNNTYEWCAPDIPSQMVHFQNAPLERILHLMETLQDRNAAQQVTQADQAETGMGDVLSSRGVSNLMIAPLRKGDALVGFLGVDNAKAFTDNPTLLHLSSDFITEEFQKRQLVWDLGKREFVDRLTGLPNRNKYLRTLEEYRQRPPRSLAVFFLDLNGLKELNEQGGHDAGDSFICQCADVLRALDLNVFRVDGDEFVIFLPDVDLAAALKQKEALREALKILEPNTVSLGLAWSEGDVDVSALVSEADDQMYAEKQVYYRQVLSQETTHRTGMATDLLRDIRSGRFVVYFQPQVELKTGRIYGAEALVRKLDEEGKLIFPDRFIPNYEAEGIISHMDFHVLELACAQMRFWREELDRRPNISVNFSRQTLMEPDVVLRVKAICKKYAVPPKQLTIEVTESTGKLTREQLMDLVKGLQDAGFAVSLDDFGSRYSNLSILTSVDFQMIKLDKSLIDHIGNEEKSTKIVKNLVHLFKDTISTPALAEGVETAEQVALLQNFNCDYVQGYYFSRPIPDDAFTELLRTGKTFSV